jgi:hypothetical protein
MKLDVLAHEGQQSFQVVVVDGPASVPDVADSTVHVPGVEEGDRVDDEPQRAKLLLLSSAVGLVQVAPATVKHGASEVVAGFLAVQLRRMRRRLASSET